VWKSYINKKDIILEQNMMLFMRMYLLSSLKMKKEKEFLKDVEESLEYRKLVFEL